MAESAEEAAARAAQRVIQRIVEEDEDGTARPDLSVLPEHVANSIDRSTIRPFAEGAWFAWRISKAGWAIDIRNGVWWTEDGSRVLSLGMGTALHSGSDVDWETYAFVGAADGKADDVCCHVGPVEAEACALTYLLHGRYCTDSPS